MKVYLDGRPLAVSAPVTMGAALRAATAEAGRRGRVVVEVEVDGSPAAESLLEDPPEEAVGAEVKMVSVEPRSLVRVTLMDAAEALEAARERQGRCAELIQIGKLDEALAPLSEAIQTWQTVRDAVEKSAQMLGMELRDLGTQAEERGLEELTALLADRLNEVRRSLSGEDWSALADVLAYDMGEQADRWKAALNAAAEGLRTA